MTVVFFLAAFLTLAVLFWPYMIPYQVTVANAAAPECGLLVDRASGIADWPVLLGTPCLKAKRSTGWTEGPITLRNRKRLFMRARSALGP
jgi:hypothetical protein